MPSIVGILDRLNKSSYSDRAWLIPRLREEIDAGADVNEVTSDGYTLLVDIIYNNSMDFLKYLVETKKIGINQQIPHHNVALLEGVVSVASRSESYGMLQYVLECGAIVQLGIQNIGRIDSLLDTARALDVEIAAIHSPQTFIDFLQRHPNDKLAFNRALSLISGLPRSHDLAKGRPWTEAFYEKLREFVTWVSSNHPTLKPGNTLSDEQVWQAFKEYLAGLSKASGSRTNRVLTGVYNPIVRKALEAGPASQPPDVDQQSHRIPLVRDVVDSIVGRPQDTPIVTLFHRHLVEKQVQAREAAPANRDNRL